MPSIQNSSSVLNFLGTIGTTDRGDNVKLNNTAKAVIALSEYLIKTAQNNLNRSGSIASGRTSDSLKIREIEIQGTKMTSTVEIIWTGKFIDQGVRGVESGKGKYSFKTKYPNKKMATALLKWMRRRSVASKYTAHTKHSKNEPKNQQIKAMTRSADNLKSLAYAVSTNIKKKGIKPTYFFEKAIAATKKKSEKEYRQALKLDIIETLQTINLK